MSVLKMGITKALLVKWHNDQFVVISRQFDSVTGYLKIGE